MEVSFLMASACPNVLLEQGQCALPVVESGFYKLMFCKQLGFPPWSCALCVYIYEKLTFFLIVIFHFSAVLLGSSSQISLQREVWPCQHVHTLLCTLRRSWRHLYSMSLVRSHYKQPLNPGWGFQASVWCNWNGVFEAHLNRTVQYQGKET